MNAFPVSDTIHPSTGERYEPINLGLTKREHFAALAMQGLLANQSDSARSYKETVEMALILSDELLKQLDQNPQP